MDFFLTPASIILLVTVFLIGGIGSLFMSRIFGSRAAGFWGHGFALVGSLLGLVIAGSVLLSGQGTVFSFMATLPGLSFDFRLDGLSAFFLGTISLISFVASLYGFSYQKIFYGHYSLGVFGFFYNAFIVSLMLVTVANHALFFLLVWEIMSLASYFLVVYEYREGENVRAGFLYFLMTHFGTVFIMIAFFLVYKATGSFNFDDWRAAAGTIAPTTQMTIFLMVLIGFGTKAGIIPLHIWLPEAHPAAPSHVSALMSGVMIKTAIFMFIRFFFDFFPVAQMEWGLVFLVIGSISSLLGVLYALSEHDLKRLLAYHSVENIGIILLGFGAALTFFGLGFENFSLLALAAALYHTLNHAIFKALLFLGAGSVVSATGTRNMEEYGGLIKLLPFTSSFFLIGALAISAFPPFNGFASEWLTFQVLFAGITSSSVIMKTIFIFAIGSLVFTGGLAAACFVKAFGATFLARPRSEEAKHAKEAGWSMLVAMGILAALTLILGISSATVIASLIGVVASISFINQASLQFPFMEFVRSRNEFSGVLSLDVVMIALVVVFVLTVLVVLYVTRSRKVVFGRTWDCGTPVLPRTEITATSFSRSLITIFQGILRPTKQTETQYHDENMRYFIKSQGVKMQIGDPYRKAFYRPVHILLTFFASQARRVQTGNVNLYLLYVFVTLIVLLVWTMH